MLSIYLMCKLHIPSTKFSTLQIWQNSCNPLSDNSEIYTIQHLGALVPGMGVLFFYQKKKKSLISETDNFKKASKNMST